MGEVISATERLEQRKTIYMFLRLAGIAEKYREEVLADPFPHLQNMSMKIARANMAMVQIDSALNGTISFVEMSAPVTEPRSIEAVMHERMKLAQKIISDYQKQGPETDVPGQCP